VLDSCGVNYVLDVVQTVQADNGIWSMACGAQGGGKSPNTDVLMVRRTGITNVPATSTKAQLYSSRLNAFDQKIFISNTAPGTVKDGLSEVRDLVFEAYYISRNSDARVGLPALRLKQLSTDGATPTWLDQEVIRGVEDIQVEFGVDPGQDTNGDGVPDDVSNDGTRIWSTVTPRCTWHPTTPTRNRARSCRFVSGFACAPRSPSRATRIHARIATPASTSHQRQIPSRADVTHGVPAQLARIQQELNMSKNRKNLRQRGAALVIGLILLAIITLLAVVGMNISNSELASASSEQVRLRASQAAETGIEYGMLEMFKPTAKTTCGWAITPPVTPVAGSPMNSATGLPTDHYATRVSYVDEAKMIDGYSSSAFSVITTSSNRTVIPVAMRSPGRCKAPTW